MEGKVEPYQRTGRMQKAAQHRNQNWPCLHTVFSMGPKMRMFYDHLCLPSRYFLVIFGIEKRRSIPHFAVSYLGLDSKREQHCSSRESGMISLFTDRILATHVLPKTCRLLSHGTCLPFYLASLYCGNWVDILPNTYRSLRLDVSDSYSLYLWPIGFSPEILVSLILSGKTVPMCPLALQQSPCCRVPD